VSLDEISKQMTKEQQKVPESAAKESPSADAQTGEGTLDDEDVSVVGEALSEEEQKKLVEKVRKREYPTPHTKRQRIKFSAIELSLLGVGALVFIFALIMIVNLIFS
jgi:hypothetical protein